MVVRIPEWIFDDYWMVCCCTQDFQKIKQPVKLVGALGAQSSDEKISKCRVFFCLKTSAKFTLSIKLWEGRARHQLFHEKKFRREFCRSQSFFQVVEFGPSDQSPGHTRLTPNSFCQWKKSHWPFDTVKYFANVSDDKPQKKRAKMCLCQVTCFLRSPVRDNRSWRYLCLWSRSHQSANETKAPTVPVLSSRNFVISKNPRMDKAPFSLVMRPKMQCTTGIIFPNVLIADDQFTQS